MNLSDLTHALATEVELVGDELSQRLNQLLTLDETDSAFMDALDGYSGQVERLGAAAEMAGFAGLLRVCACVTENALAAAAAPLQQRADFRPFLAGWPLLVVNYLRNLSDPSTAAGLVDHLRAAPLPLDQTAAGKVMHMLGATPQSDAMLDAGSRARAVLASAEDVELLIPEDVEPTLMEGFIHEAPTQTAYLTQLARNLVAGSGDSSDLIAAKRVAHTLKGSASIIGIRGVAVLAHHSEDILEFLERHPGNVPRHVAEVLLEAAYCLEQMVGYSLANDERPANAQAVLQAVLDVANRIDRGETFDTPDELPQRPQADASELAKATTPAPAPVKASGNVVMASSAALRVPVTTVEELFRLSGEISVRMAALETRLKQTTHRSRDMLAQNLRVQKRLFELETLVDVRALTMMRAHDSHGTTGAENTFDPLELDQYNELHSTTHALMEEAADARGIGMRLEDEITQLQTVQLQQQRLAADLQHLVMSTRMTAVGVLASRLQRNVRATCLATGKQAELELSGVNIQIDGDVLNKLADPLLHLLRNAVDHGIETPKQRLAAGKSASGSIVLSFDRIGQQAVVRCSDDGRGLDLDAVRNRALERGLIEVGHTLSDEEIAHLVFLPGFSTRDAVTEISGRGVGLDVVREWAVTMNGNVHITSRPGQGCTIELRFQALLTTMHALIVEVAGQRFAIPSINVVQAVARGLGEFATVASELMFHLGKQKYSSVRLAGLAGLVSANAPPLTEHDAVLVRIGNTVHALAVERLVDARELLIKDAGRFAKHMRGVAGMALLGDGSVAVLLDLPQLLTASRATQKTSGQTTHGPRIEMPAHGVLIVDDSLSVRNSLSQLVTDAGYHAVTARDGVEAIEALRHFMPSLVLTDLEMPNMNGLELTMYIRHREDLRHLPVIMITSRSQDKHRHQAEKAGVDGYFTKPYTDTDLLKVIRQSLAA